MKELTYLNMVAVLHEFKKNTVQRTSAQKGVQNGVEIHYKINSE